MPTPAANLDRVGILVNGFPYVAEPADPGTKIYNVNGREAITSTGPNAVISLSTTAMDTELADRAAAARRVKDAAAGPWTPKAERPSARVAARRLAAKQYHASVWSHAYEQGQADLLRQPLNERLTESDMPALIERVLGEVLANPELREQYLKAADAAAFEDELGAA